jgi:DNA segregation ATPase FtsK/SpoIIIE, S-DNA-T family
MGVTESDYSDDMGLADRLREGLERLSAQALGLVVLAGVGMLAASLATWSVGDPSFSNATDARPENLFGFPGAAIADLLIQLLGLAAPVILLPLTAWSIALLRDRPITSPSRRVVAWIVGCLLASAFFAVVPKPGSWPLPSGLGGLLGDAQLYVTGMLLSPILGGLAAIPAGLLAGAGAVMLLTFACGRSSSRHTLEADQQPARHWDDAPDFEEGDEPEGRVLKVGGFEPVGALVHGWLSLRARLRRLPAAPVVLWRRLTEHEQELVAVPPAHRLEPRFDDTEDAWSVAEEDDAEDWTEQPVPESAATERVRPARTRLKQGRRAACEAQPSFLDARAYELPPLRLLEEPKQTRGRSGTDTEGLEQNARLLETVLDDFGVKGDIINVRPGPVVTLYELEPAPGTKSSRVIGLADDIARSMSAVSARVAVVSGRNAIGIELPNSHREMVYLRELLASENFEKSKAKLPLCLGKTIGGEPVIADLARMPHLLIAGTTGSGKSVAVNTMILSLLYRLPPDVCKLIMIDPKMLELSIYDGIPHLLSPVVTDPKKAVVALKWTVREMEDRYRKMSKLGVRNIDGYNARVAQAAKRGETVTRTVQTGFDRETGEPVYEQEEMDLEPMPYLVVIVDEMADLMMVAGKDIEGAVQRLAQMARAAGIHIITATQRPSVDVITGTIKANFPTRISFQVTSKIDSRTILGEQGAEQLLGQGDMLYMMGGGRITRVHGPFVSDEEVEDVVAYLKTQGTPDYLEDITEEPDDGPYDMGGLVSGGEGDDLYRQAIKVVIRDGKASTSYVQRRLSIGYNRAASLIERMEEDGIISRPNSKGQREILAGAEQDD